MRVVLSGYALGVLLMSYAPRVLSVAEWSAVAVAALGCFFVGMRIRRITLRCGALLCAGVFLGVVWMNGAAKDVIANMLPHEWESRDIWVEGYVDSLPVKYTLGDGSRKQEVQRFEFAVERFYSIDDKKIPLSVRRLNVRWYNAEVLVRPATRWRLLVRLKRPHGFSNPGGGDYTAYLLARDVHATGYVRPNTDNRRLSGNDVLAYHHRLRAYLREQFMRTYTGPRKGLILALGIGDKSALNEDTRTVLRDSGTAHLLAISGLHIGFVALLLYRLFATLARMSVHMLLFAPAACWGAAAALPGALIYAALAGFALPTQRALIMVVIALLAIWWRRQLSFSAGFCVALAVVLGIQPLAGHTAGFWLSFVAVGALLVFFRTPRNRFDTQRRWSASLRELLEAQYAVGVALLVPLGIFFHAIPTLSFVNNLFAIPLVSIVVVPLVLLGFVLMGVVPDVAVWAFVLAGTMLDFLVAALGYVLRAFSGFSVWYPSAWSVWAVLLALLGSGMALWLQRWRYRLPALLLLLPLALPTTSYRDVLRVEMLDVGQGLAVLIQTAGHAMLYDAGPRYSRSDAGGLVLLPALRYRGVRNLDMLLLSHRDVDHVGGANTVLRRIPVHQLLISAPHADADAKKARLFSDAEPCYAGQHWRWDEVDFEILHPPQHFDMSVENNRSCVLLVRTERHSVLLSGDIDKNMEEMLLARLETQTPLSALFASHHGSRSSSPTRWVNGLRPHYVLYSTGYRNRFRHPHPVVEARFNAVGSHAFNSAKSGAVLLRVDKLGRMRATSWRALHRRFWH